MSPEEPQREEGVADPGDVLERVDQTDEQRPLTPDDRLVECHLRLAAQQPDPGPRQHHQRKRQQVQRVPGRQPPVAIGGCLGIEIDQRPVEQGERVAHAEEVREPGDQSRGVVRRRGEVDGEGEHRHGEEPVGGAIPPPGGEDAGQQQSLERAQQGDQVEPVEGDALHQGRGAKEPKGAPRPGGASMAARHCLDLPETDLGDPQ